MVQYFSLKLTRAQLRENQILCSRDLLFQKKDGDPVIFCTVFLCFAEINPANQQISQQKYTYKILTESKNIPPL